MQPLHMYLPFSLQLEAEADHEQFTKSTIVASSAPKELGSLRQADGQEGFEKPEAAAAGAAHVSVVAH